MEFIFSQSYDGDREDGQLISLAKAGDSSALEELIGKHQVWIYHLALRMVGRRDDAEDVTEEVLGTAVRFIHTQRNP